jgi:hypothetical protein
MYMWSGLISPRPHNNLAQNFAHARSLPGARAGARRADRLELAADAPEQDALRQALVSWLHQRQAVDQARTVPRVSTVRQEVATNWRGKASSDRNAAFLPASQTQCRGVGGMRAVQRPSTAIDRPSGRPRRAVNCREADSGKCRRRVFSA